MKYSNEFSEIELVGEELIINHFNPPSPVAEKQKFSYRISMLKKPKMNLIPNLAASIVIIIIGIFIAISSQTQKENVVTFTKTNPITWEDKSSSYSYRSKRDLDEVLVIAILGIVITGIGIYTLKYKDTKTISMKNTKNKLIVLYYTKSKEELEQVYEEINTLAITYSNFKESF